MLLGDPLGSTPVIATVPLASLRFSAAVLVWSDSGQTTLSYVSAPELATRWWITDTAAQTAGDIEEIVDVVINR